MSKWILALFVLLSCGRCVAQSPYTNSIFPAQLATASAQTLSTIALSGSSGSAAGSSFAAGTLTVTGTALTTVTFQIDGSSDNGATFYALPIYTQNSPTTAAATSITATTSGLYQVSLVGLTHIKIVTSGTFTATQVSFVFTATPQATIAKGGTSGGGTTGTINSASAFAPTYYPGLGTTVSGATPFTGPQCDSTSGAPAGCTLSQLIPYLGTTTGLVNVLAGSLPASLGTPTQAQLVGVPISLTANLANTNTTPSLNINALGAITIVKGSSTALIAGDINIVTPALVIYNGTNYVLLNPQLGLPQTSSSGNFQAGPTGSNTLVASTFSSASSGTSLSLTVPAGSSASALGSAVMAGGTNSSTGAGGNSVLRPGQNSGGGQQGFAQVLQSFTTASALAATFEAVAMTSTADQVGAAAAGSLTTVGIAQSAGGTGTAIFVASHGKTTARFDGTPVIGDVACYPPATTGNAGLLHDNGTSACTLTQETAGVVTGQVSGSGSGATATILIR